MDKAKDPVCGVSVDPESTRHYRSAEGKDYYFCSETCLRKFESNQETGTD